MVPHRIEQPNPRIHDELESGRIVFELGFAVKIRQGSELKHPIPVTYEFATRTGGLFATGLSDVVMNGTVVFQNNSAREYGGE